MLLPSAIERVELRAPEAPTAGEPFAWWASVQDSEGKVIDASIPVRIRLLASGGAAGRETVLRERFAAASASGANGKLTVPVNAPEGALVLEAAELLSGRSVRLALSAKPRATPFAIAARGSR